MDYVAIAATLNVEITTDGSVLIHGILDTLPAHIGLQVAQIAATAATDRLELITSQ